VTAGRNEEV